MDKQHFIVTGFIGLALYLISSGLSYATFTYVGNKTSTAVSPAATANGTQQHFVIDPSIPRTQPYRSHLL